MHLKALLVDDDPDTAAIYASWFKAREHRLAVCHSAKDALANARKSRPDVILMDVFLGDSDGFTLCAELKADAALRDIPVIMMSALGRETHHIVRGLTTGADDYLLKEFDREVLFAKIDAVLRRSQPPAAAVELLGSCGVALDVAARTAKANGKDLPLTRKEFDLLALLMRSKGRTVAFKSLLEHVWGYDTKDYDDPHTVRVHIHQLKKKLGAAFAKRLKTVVGVGYRLD